MAAQETIRVEKVVSGEEPKLRITEDVERIAGQIGVEPKQIRQLKPDWARLMREGVIAKVHVGRWRAKTQLTYADIGLELNEEEEKAMSSVLKLGHKLLAPAEVIQEGDAIENYIRRELKRLSFETHWGSFVPATAYAELKQAAAECEARYMALRDSVTSPEGYKAMIEKVMKEHRRVAASTYGRLQKIRPKLVEGIEVEDFCDRFVERILSHIPSAEAIRASFSFDVELLYVPLPDLLAEQNAAAQIIEERATTEAAHEQAERERVWERRRMEAYAADAERQRINAEVRAAERAAEARERLMREMHRDVIAQAQKQKEKMINGFLGDIQGQLAGIIYEACVSALEYISDEGKFHPRKSVQLQKMVERVEALNFFGDEDSARMIQEVQQQLAIPAEKRSLAELEGKLRDIAAVTRDTLISLGETPRSAANAGVADVVTDVVLREARGRLGLGGFEVTFEESELPLRSGRAQEEAVELVIE